MCAGWTDQRTRSELQPLADARGWLAKTAYLQKQISKNDCRLPTADCRPRVPTVTEDRRLPTVTVLRGPDRPARRHSARRSCAPVRRERADVGICPACGRRPELDRHGLAGIDAAGSTTSTCGHVRHVLLRQAVGRRRHRVGRGADRIERPLRARARSCAASRRRSRTRPRRAGRRRRSARSGRTSSGRGRRPAAARRRAPAAATGGSAAPAAPARPPAAANATWALSSPGFA